MTYLRFWRTVSCIPLPPQGLDRLKKSASATATAKSAEGSHPSSGRRGEPAGTQRDTQGRSRTACAPGGGPAHADRTWGCGPRGGAAPATARCPGCRELPGFSVRDGLTAVPGGLVSHVIQTTVSLSHRVLGHREPSGGVRGRRLHERLTPPSRLPCQEGAPVGGTAAGTRLPRTPILGGHKGGGSPEPLRY